MPRPVPAWPAATRRALTGAERDWLEAVPCSAGGTVLVEFRGVESWWVRPFFCGWVRDALERDAARVGVEDGLPLALMPAGVHRVLSGGAEEPASPRARPGRSFFSTLNRGGTYASHCCPND